MVGVVCVEPVETATRGLSRYKKYSERVRSSQAGRVCRIYGSRARHLVKTTLMPCPEPVNANDYSGRIAGNAAYSVIVLQHPRHCALAIDIRVLARNTNTLKPS